MRSLAKVGPRKDLVRGGIRSCAVVILGLLGWSSWPGPDAGAWQEKASEPAQGKTQSLPLPEGTKALLDLPYVPQAHVRQKLDLFLPAEGKGWPLVAWIHGGAWLRGDKSDNPALRFMSQGYAVASINYRFSQDAIFPAQIEDCKAAIRWLKAHAREYGYDGDRIGVWGASAGGHLAALLGTSADVNDFDAGPGPRVSTRVQAVCDFCGVSDVLALGRQLTPEFRYPFDTPDSPLTLLFGGRVPERKEQAVRASPLTYVSPDDPPFLLVHGDRDLTVPIGQSELLHDMLRNASVDSTFHVAKGEGHVFTSLHEVGPLVDAFFARHLKTR
jgi:acetyl esterase/lipase